MYGIKIDHELNTFQSLLMNKVKVSNKDYHQIIRQKNQASNFLHIQYNHLSGSNYIAIDIDNDIFNTLEETNLKPNLVVANSSNNKAHCYFRLNSFVGTTEKSRMKPQRALRLLTHSINNNLSGDKKFNGMQAKNPLHDDFRVFSYSNKGYDFDELFDNIPKKHIYIYKPEIIETKEAVESPGRNCYLFEIIRYFSYRIKWKCESYDELYNQVEDFGIRANENLTDPIGHREVFSIIKSVTNFTWAVYVGGNEKNRGVMELGSKGHNLTLQDKQVLGAQYSAKNKRESSYKAISEAFYYLIGKDIKPTQKAVSKRSGKGIATVKRYWKQLER